MSERPSAVSLGDVFRSFEETWAPRVVASVNDWAVKAAKLEGEYVWHSHPDTDELFLVVEGELTIRLRLDPADAAAETVVHLTQGDLYVVPRGVEHCPVSSGAQVLLLEPAATVSTGDYAGEVPDHITSTVGLPGG